MSIIRKVYTKCLILVYTKCLYEMSNTKCLYEKSISNRKYMTNRNVYTKSLYLTEKSIRKVYI